jgi:probable rRNA maturation factor
MIEVISRLRAVRIRTGLFERLLRRLVRRYRLGNPDVVLAFIGPGTIRRLNRTFRKKDKVTDVLSFPAAGPGPEGRRNLGDILICGPKAARQAAELGHGLEAELAFLTIHGFLHLLGYEHFRGHEEEEARIVRRLRREGVPPLPPEQVAAPPRRPRRTLAAKKK